MIKLQTRENSLKNTAKADYIFVVSTEDSLYMDAVCQFSVENGGTVPADMMQLAVKQYFKAERKLACEGKMITTPNYYLRPSAHGTTTNAQGVWGNSEDHYLEPLYTHTAEFKADLNAQTVSVINERILGPQIGDVYDYFTKVHVNQPDPSGVTRSAITPTRAMGISGRALRILPLELGEIEVGIFFIKEGTTPIISRIPNNDIMQNEPSILQFIIPNLAPANYSIEIRTLSNTAGNGLVKTLRTVRYKHTVSVIPE